MGLLDDAIREHLELQRRRGADPTEVARAEQEALGPVRREPVATSSPADDLAETHHDDEPGLAPDERLEPSGYASEAAPVREDEDPRAEPHEAPVRRRAPDDADAPVRDTWESDPEPPTRSFDAATGLPRDTGRPVPPRKRPAPADEPTTEHRIDDADDDAPPRSATPDAGPAADEDVLEETPDFLQETPEHDRLWFEQRPPRDFDFDG